MNNIISDAINDFGRKMGKVFLDRSKTVGASEIGLCARRMHWLKTKTVPDAARTYAKKTGDKRRAMQEPENWGAHVRGSTIETELWVPAMRARFGNALRLAGEDQETFVVDQLSATPDGIVVGRGNELVKGAKDVVVECKTIDPRVNLVAEKFEHSFQVQVQMGVIREKTKYRPEWAVISYIDASFWHDVTEYAVKFDERQYEAAKLRAAKILNSDAGDLRPEGWIAGGKECGWCAWSKRCGEMRGGVPQEAKQVSSQKKAEVVDLCRQALERRRVRDTADTQYKDLQDQIRNLLRDADTRKIEDVVTWSAVKGRTSWDMEALVTAAKAKGINTDKYCTVGEPTTSLTINEKVFL